MNVMCYANVTNNIKILFLKDWPEIPNSVAYLKTVSNFLMPKYRLLICKIAGDDKACKIVKIDSSPKSECFFSSNKWLTLSCFKRGLSITVAGAN